MRVAVDTELCEANGICMGCCPEVFRLEEDDTLTILADEIPESLEPRVKDAARLCPRQALTILD